MIAMIHCELEDWPFPQDDFDLKEGRWWHARPAKGTEPHWAIEQEPPWDVPTILPMKTSSRKQSQASPAKANEK